MAYYVEVYKEFNYIYTYDGEPLKYRLETYEGPFRTLEDATAYIRQYKYDDVKILDLG